MDDERSKKRSYRKQSMREDDSNAIQNLYSQFVDGNRSLASDDSATSVADDSLQARVLKILKNAEQKLNIEDDTEFEFTTPSNMNTNVSGNESSGNISDRLADFNKHIRPLKRKQNSGEDKFYYDDTATCKCGRPYDLRYRVYPGIDRSGSCGSESTYFYAAPELLKKFKKAKLKKRCSKTSQPKRNRYENSYRAENKRKRDYSDDEESVVRKSQWDDSSTSFKTAHAHVDDVSTKYGRAYDNTKSNRNEFHKYRRKTRKQMAKRIGKYPDTDDSRPEIVIRDSATNKKRAIRCNSREYHDFMKLLNK